MQTKGPLSHLCDYGLASAGEHAPSAVDRLSVETVHTAVAVGPFREVFAVAVAGVGVAGTKAAVLMPVTVAGGADASAGCAIAAGHAGFTLLPCGQVLALVAHPHPTPAGAVLVAATVLAAVLSCPAQFTKTLVFRLP